MLGVYAVNRSLWDVGMLIFFGILGYLMKKVGIPSAAMLLAFVLGHNIEYTMIQTLASSKYGFMLLFKRPISATLMTLSIIILIVSLYSAIKKKRDHLSSDAEI